MRQQDLQARMMKFAMLAKPIEGYCIHLMGTSVAYGGNDST
jgi:hypothetical protein